MQLEHTFTVPAEIEDAWKALLDIELIAPCMPGAALDSVDGDEFSGTVKVRLGPIGLTYKGKASFVEKDEAAHRAVINAQGKDARGNGTANAKVTATLSANSAGGPGTSVHVLTDLNITGKPAQFGRGVMVDVGNKLIGQFADCLADKLTGTDTSEGAAQGEAAAAAAAGADASEGGVDAGEAAQAAAAGASGAAVDGGVAAVQAAAVADAAAAGDTVQAPVGSDVTAALPARAAGMAGEPMPSAGDASIDASGVAAEQAPTASVPAPAADAAAATSPAATADSPAATAPAAVAAAAGSRRPVAHREVEPIDLLGSAGPAVAKRLAPVLIGLAVAVLFVLRRRGCGRDR